MNTSGTQQMLIPVVPQPDTRVTKVEEGSVSVIANQRVNNAIGELNRAVREYSAKPARREIGFHVK